MRSIIPGLQAFEFITSTGRRLELAGALLSWQDKHTPGLAEHQILRRKGAIHQDMGSQPRRFTFKCTFLGQKVAERYKTLSDSIEEDPTGNLVHPRFGHTKAVCTELQATEDPATAVNEIQFTISFSETELRTAPRDSVGNIAAAAQSRADELRAAARARYASATASLSTAVSSFSGIATATSAAPQELARVLAEVNAQVVQLQVLATLGGEYDLFAQAALVLARTIEAYNAVQSQRPPVILFPVPADMGLAALCAALYGGRLARTTAAEIRQLNRIPTPHRIPAGTLLLLADPEIITRAR